MIKNRRKKHNLSVARAFAGAQPQTVSTTSGKKDKKKKIMHKFKDNQGRSIRLSEERLDHIESDHPEMVSQFDRISETLAEPDRIIRSRTDALVELFYKHYASTPVSSKFLCIVVRAITDDNFIITSYYTDSVKRGELLWEKK